ncbi:hypothetical protein [Streptomyces sp. MMBL 11-1]|uniref:hypothetical protein n=1 Tax=Streptomyces sp. MMBL 11-1 TaxID=3026420 RepID=UPI00235E6BB5|nr:hypothetical protein [Streptomyces sp. MMBL 11-1]
MTTPAAKTIALSDRSHWEPAHILGIGLSAYVISLALYRGMGREGALSITATHGAAQIIAIGLTVTGVCLGLTAMAYVVIRDSLRPMAYIAAYILIFATMALLRVETTFAANFTNALRYLAVAAVATAAWLYEVRETSRAHQ